jgi:hypothetical protein
MDAYDAGRRGRRQRWEPGDIGKCLTGCIQDGFNVMIIAPNSVVNAIDSGAWNSNVAHQLIDVVPVTDI